MQERRKTNRKYLAVYSRVIDRGSGRVLGYLADLSQKGTMIISGEPMPEKEILNLRFDLPDPTLFPIDHLDLQASVAWSSPDIDPAFYNVGFQFLAVDEKQAKIIDEMIVAYEFDRTRPDYPTSASML